VPFPLRSGIEAPTAVRVLALRLGGRFRAVVEEPEVERGIARVVREARHLPRPAVGTAAIHRERWKHGRGDRRRHGRRQVDEGQVTGLVVVDGVALEQLDRVRCGEGTRPGVTVRSEADTPVLRAIGGGVVVGDIPEAVLGGQDPGGRHEDAGALGVVGYLLGERIGIEVERHHVGGLWVDGPEPDRLLRHTELRSRRRRRCIGPAGRADGQEHGD